MFGFSLVLWAKNIAAIVDNTIFAIRKMKITTITNKQIASTRYYYIIMIIIVLFLRSNEIPMRASSERGTVIIIELYNIIQYHIIIMLYHIYIIILLSSCTYIHI